KPDPAGLSAEAQRAKVEAEVRLATVLPRNFRSRDARSRGATAGFWKSLSCGLLLAGWMAGVAPLRAEADCFADALDRAAGAPVVAGEGGWLYLPSELRFLSVGEFWGEAALDTGKAMNLTHRDPLGPIDDFNRQLADLDVNLLLVPVPPKALVYPAPLACTREASRVALDRLRTFYALLRERGVQVLDLTEDYLTPEALAEGRLYCQTDTHWTGLGVQRAARRIHEWIQMQEFASNVSGSATWTVTPGERAISGDLDRMRGTTGSEAVPVHEVRDAAGLPPPADMTRPILLLGDSHVLVYSAGADLHGTGAGLPDHLAALTGGNIDVLGVRGSGATTSRISLLRRMKSDPAYLKNKKLIIWCFTAREFTEADAWRFVPLPVL
ncbi:MAG TPA: hypothetical protein PKE12_14115, partial [Kiritimatiellia bacterium]|nr:hypothetical protein [Kiritimatiellia bacterium]